jgi:hypothetical protein
MHRTAPGLGRFFLAKIGQRVSAPGPFSPSAAARGPNAIARRAPHMPPFIRLTGDGQVPLGTPPAGAGLDTGAGGTTSRLKMPPTVVPTWCPRRAVQGLANPFRAVSSPKGDHMATSAGRM